MAGGLGRSATRGSGGPSPVEGPPAADPGLGLGVRPAGTPAPAGGGRDGVPQRPRQRRPEPRRDAAQPQQREGRVVRQALRHHPRRPGLRRAAGEGRRDHRRRAEHDLGRRDDPQRHVRRHRERQRLRDRLGHRRRPLAARVPQDGQRRRRHQQPAGRHRDQRPEPVGCRLQRRLADRRDHRDPGHRPGPGRPLRRPEHQRDRGRHQPLPPAAPRVEALRRDRRGHPVRHRRHRQHRQQHVHQQHAGLRLRDRRRRHPQRPVQRHGQAGGPVQRGPPAPAAGTRPREWPCLCRLGVELRQPPLPRVDRLARRLRADHRGHQARGRPELRPQRRRGRDLDGGHRLLVRGRRRRPLCHGRQRPRQRRQHHPQRGRLPRRRQLLRRRPQGRRRHIHFPVEPEHERLGAEGRRLLHPVQPEGPRQRRPRPRLQRPAPGEHDGRPRASPPADHRGQGGRGLRPRPRQPRPLRHPGRRHLRQQRGQ